MNDQQMQQFLGYLQQQMQNQQQQMADLPQRALQAGATPTQGSGGTILSPDPVQRVRQANQAWRERFPLPVEAAGRVGMTPEGFLANQGNTATNQLAQLGFMAGIDPQKVIEANQARKQYSDFAKAQREGTNGVTSQIPASEYAPGVNYRVGQAGSGSVAADGTRTITSPYGTASMGPQGGAQVAQAAPQAPAAPVTAGTPTIPVGDIFSGAASAVAQVPTAIGNAVNSAQNWWKENVLPNAQPATSVAPPIEGSSLRQNVLQGLNFIPNLLTAGSAKLAEGLGSIFGEQIDLPGVNFQSDVFSNVKNILENNAGNDAERARLSANRQLGNEGAYDSVAGPNQDEQRNALLQNRIERNANPGVYLGVPNQPMPALQLSQPNATPQAPIAFQGNVTPASLLPQNMFMTEEERKRRQTNQPMFAGR
jgi:hypothetical protein